MTRESSSNRLGVSIENVALSCGSRLTWIIPRTNSSKVIICWPSGFKTSHSLLI